MQLKEINITEINLKDYPKEMREYLISAKIYDSSCSENAKVIFINNLNNNCGYFLKSMKSPGYLHGESYMTEYFYSKRIAPKVLSFVKEYNGYEFMLTEKIAGSDCLEYLDNPERLCDILAGKAAFLHSLDCADCLVNHGEFYKNEYKSLLKAEVLIHGDYCLPNIILDDWKFSGFIDLDSAGVGDRHVDIFWAIWSLNYNLKFNGDKYRERFIEVYEDFSKVKIDREKLNVIELYEKG